MDYERTYMKEFEAALAEAGGHHLEVRVAKRRSELAIIQAIGPFIGLAGALFMGMLFSGEDFFTLMQAGVMLICLLLVTAALTMMTPSATVRLAAAQNALDSRNSHQCTCGHTPTAGRQAAVGERGLIRRMLRQF